MYHLEKITTVFLAVTLMSMPMAAAQELSKLEKLPAARLDSSANGILREICLEEKSFIYYSGRAGSSLLQLMNGNKAQTCDSKELVIQKQVEVVSTRLKESQGGVIRTYNFGNNSILLFTAKNGAATLIQLSQ